jgi:putative hydroxymethylpyrimidine transport system substrate-binding protein
MRSKSLLAAIAFATALFATPALAADKLTVLLDWFVNPDHAPLVVAKEKGFFEQQGLDVQLVPPADPSAVPRLVGAGQADVGVYYQPNLYLDHAAGVPIVRFGTLVETPLNTVIALADGPIKSLADLKGKSVGYSVSGFEDALLAEMLASAGLDLKDVKLVNVNFSLSPSLIAGKVDAVIGGYRNFELNQMRLAGHPGRAFFPEEQGVPPYDELIYITRPQLAHDPRLARFLAAVEKATLWLTNHPDDAWQAFIAAHSDLNDALNKKAWQDTLPRFSKSPAAFDPERYKRFADFLVKRGLIKQAPPLGDISVEVGERR